MEYDEVSISADEGFLLEVLRERGVGASPIAKLLNGGLFASCLGLWKAEAEIFEGGFTGRGAAELHRTVRDVAQHLRDRVPDPVIVAQQRADFSHLEHLPADEQLMVFMLWLLERQRDRLVCAAPGRCHPTESPL